MSQTQTTSQPSNFKMLRAMVGIGVLCALLIVLTYEGTLPRVEQLKEEALQNAIFKVLPGAESTQLFVLDGNELVQKNEKSENQQSVYAGYSENGALIGMAIPASGQGYADVIKILYGYDPVKEQIIGFQVLESKETPGLGDKIEKDENFLANFHSMDAALDESKSTKKNEIITVKSGTKVNSWEVDGITGATISSRAIAAILDSSTEDWAPILARQLKEIQKEGSDE